jgi:hypothetical protein
MKKFQFIGSVLLILSACSPQPTPLPALQPAATLTSTPTVQAPTSTPKATVTAGTPEALVTSTVAATPTPCKDSALNTNWLRDDVPYNFTDFSQNKPIPPNGHFTMTWTLQNTGTCTWDASYVIAFKSGYRMTRSPSFPIVMEGNTIEPGQNTIVNISMIAPVDTGGHQAEWQLQSRDGTALLKFNLVIKVDRGTYSPPARPVQLTYKTNCSAGVMTVRLFWVDSSNNEEGFRIYRNSKMLVQLPANTDTVLDAVTLAGKYNYTVVAFNASGEGSANTFAEITNCK